MILFVQIGDLRQSDLIARILVLKLIQDILAPSDNTYGIISAVSWISSDSIIAYANKIWTLIRAISWTSLNVILSSSIPLMISWNMHRSIIVVFIYIATTLMRIILRVLLTIN